MDAIAYGQSGAIGPDLATHLVDRIGQMVGVHAVAADPNEC